MSMDMMTLEQELDTATEYNDTNPTEEVLEMGRLVSEAKVDLMIALQSAKDTLSHEEVVEVLASEGF